MSIRVAVRIPATRLLKLLVAGLFAIAFLVADNSLPFDIVHRLWANAMGFKV